MWAFLIALLVKNLPAMQETQVRFLGQEEGNGNPVQYSCLSNPRDKGAWRAAVHGLVRVGHNLVINSPPRYYYFKIHKHKSEICS